MDKRLVLITIFFCPILFEGPGNLPNPNLDTLQTEPVSGVYFLQGTIIEYTYDFPWPQWGGEKVILDTDTTTISFLTTIRMVEEKRDTVQFFGLPGANASRNSILPVECENPSFCGYANFEMGSLQIDYRTPAGEFSGTGWLDGEILTLDTYFEYREIGIEYKLQGKKIDEEEL
ncbi:hypothetical protein [Rhodohalobacter sulfatireducens]|uniref:DUF3299 domain-containing protein n=1 Tax=Rhodohalobacter sulfatireducens TaxID=2911366 RepID=A0ABS9KIC8_9BACT|nr:hypothetical protein [Rhodohalobacter sulfatireducens]MCG2590607.1 hypothetical protein [Rhodohalobacter sulfatireducens]MDR9364940.1 hypothetical protein [Balneolaceae bacterium]MDR9408234.1 hypothetical protein [Balneolaceae bacterium]